MPDVADICPPSGAKGAKFSKYRKDGPGLTPNLSENRSGSAHSGGVFVITDAGGYGFPLSREVGSAIGGHDVLNSILNGDIAKIKPVLDRGAKVGPQPGRLL